MEQITEVALISYLFSRSRIDLRLKYLIGTSTLKVMSVEKLILCPLPDTSCTT